MSNSSPPWDAYRSLMACHPIALGKCLVVRPVGIGETLCRAIVKLVMRAAGDHAKMVCGSLQLCVGLESGIEGATHAVAQRRRERHMPEPEGGADESSEGSEEERTAATSRVERAGGA